MADEAPKRGGWVLTVGLSAAATIAGLYLCVGQTSAPPRPTKPAASPSSEIAASSTAGSTAPSGSATPSSTAATSAGAPPTGATPTNDASSSTGAPNASQAASGKPAALPDGPAPPPSPGETRVRAIWDARAQRRPGNALLGGTACTVEATLANVSGAIVVRGVTVRCDKNTLHDPDGLPADATVTAAELPALDRGSFVYTLQYRDGRAEIDTRHGRTEVDVSKPTPGTAFLLVANESRPVTQKLLPATPDERALYAGSRPSPETDDRTTGKITAVTGDTLLQAGAKCALAFHPYGTIDGIERCDVLVQCGGVILIGRPELFSSHCKRNGARVVSATDPQAQPADSDPGLLLDERTARIWSDATGGRWSVLLALDPR